MATWDERTFQRRIEPTPEVPVVRQVPQIIAAGLTALLLASGPYWALRATMLQASVSSTIRGEPAEITPVTRSSGATAVRPGQGRTVGSRAGRFVVAFGRFERLESAKAQARLVRSKGYIAAVVRSGTAYVVVSRQYRSLADAKFWSSIFSKLGLEAKALTRLEARRHQQLTAAL